MVSNGGGGNGGGVTFGAFGGLNGGAFAVCFFGLMQYFCGGAAAVGLTFGGGVRGVAFGR